MILANRDHQGRLLVGRVLGVDFGAPIDQQLHRLEHADTRRDHQHRLARLIDGVWIGARVEQQPHHRRTAVTGRQRERRDSIPVGELRVRARLDQQTRDIGIVEPHGAVKRRSALHVGRVDVHLLGEERAHGGDIPLAGGVRQARIRSRRNRAGGEQSERGYHPHHESTGATCRFHGHESSKIDNFRGFYRRIG
jgi:hypothetical protein